MFRLPAPVFQKRRLEPMYQYPCLIAMGMPQEIMRDLQRRSFLLYRRTIYPRGFHCASNVRKCLRGRCDAWRFIRRNRGFCSGGTG